MTSTINPRTLKRRVITSVVVASIVLGTVALAEIYTLPMLVYVLTSVVFIWATAEFVILFKDVGPRDGWAGRILGALAITQVFMVPAVYDQFGFGHLVLLLLMVWGFDIGAYFSGKLWGRTKLCPELSPGKTQEGVWGGLALATVVCFISQIWVPIKLWFVLVLVVSIAAQLGDLFESWLKRLARVKNSGDTLPGHGGMLDRIDGLLFASTAYYLFVLLVR